MEKHNKKVKYIAYSDVHLAMWKQFNEGLRRTKNGIDVIKRIKGIAKVLKADVLFLGDLFAIFFKLSISRFPTDFAGSLLNSASRFLFFGIFIIFWI